MTYADLLERLSVDASLGPAEVRSVLGALLDALVVEVLWQGGVVRIPEVGTFYRRRRAARPVRNPVSGERMDLPPLVDVGFRPAKTLKRRDVTT